MTKLEKAQAIQIAKAEKRIETAEFIQKQSDLLLRQKEKVWKERVEVQALQIVKLRKDLLEIGSRTQPPDVFKWESIQAILNVVHGISKKALALDTKDAEKMVAEMKADVLIEASCEIARWDIKESWHSLITTKLRQMAQAARARSEGKS